MRSVSLNSTIIKLKMIAVPWAGDRAAPELTVATLGHFSIWWLSELGQKISSLSLNFSIYEMEIINGT